MTSFSTSQQSSVAPSKASEKVDYSAPGLLKDAASKLTGDRAMEQKGLAQSTTDGPKDPELVALKIKVEKRGAPTATSGGASR